MNNLIYVAIGNMSHKILRLNGLLLVGNMKALETIVSKWYTGMFQMGPSLPRVSDYLLIWRPLRSLW
jgi:hypothetical protein